MTAVAARCGVVDEGGVVILGLEAIRSGACDDGHIGDGNRSGFGGVVTGAQRLTHHFQEHIMNKTPRTRALVAGIGVVLALGIGTAVAVAADGDTEEPPVPVEPDGGIGDTPGDEFPVDQARDDAHGLLGRSEADLPADVRIARKGTEQFALTEDYMLGRLTVELDAEGDDYRVTSVTVELPGGPETFELTPG